MFGNTARLMCNPSPLKLGCVFTQMEVFLPASLLPDNLTTSKKDTLVRKDFVKEPVITFGSFRNFLRSYHASKKASQGKCTHRNNTLMT